MLTRWNAPDTTKLAEAEARKRREEFDAIVSSRHRFIQSISHIPYFRVRLAKCRGKYPDTEQKGVDTRITLDMLDLSRKGAFETAILASGDSDLVEVVESVTADGRHVELVYYEGSAGNDLLQVCDCCRVLDAEFIKICLK